MSCVLRGMVSKFDFGLDPGVLWAHDIYLLISTRGGALALPTLTLLSSHTLGCSHRGNSESVSLSGILVDPHAHSLPLLWP